MSARERARPWWRTREHSRERRLRLLKTQREWERSSRDRHWFEVPVRSATGRDIPEARVLAVLGLALTLLLTACGASFTDADESAARDSVHLGLHVLGECERDGGACAAAPVRALTRASVCGQLAVLYRHRHEVDAGGLQCQP